MKTTQFRNGKWLAALKTAIAGMATATALAACDMTHVDLNGCEQGLDVEFVYDYNIEQADMFRDQVGSVTLYVYDQQGRLVRTQTQDNTDDNGQPLRRKEYRMKVEDLEEGEYHLLAVANQQPYQSISQLGGVRYLRNEPTTDIHQLEVTLKERNAWGREPVTATDISQQLDTLWHGTLRSAQYTQNPTTRADDNLADPGEQLVAAQTASVMRGELTHCVVSLMRDTKRLHLSLYQDDKPSELDIKDFDIYITDQNGHLLWDNTVSTTLMDPTLTYRPFEMFNTYIDPNTGESSYTKPRVAPELEDKIQVTGHAFLDFNRLMLRRSDNNIDENNDDAQQPQPAWLYVWNRKEPRTDGEPTISVNLAEFLAYGRYAERIIYTPQQYLDREHNYSMDFILVGGEWVRVKIHTMPWTTRKSVYDGI